MAQKSRTKPAGRDKGGNKRSKAGEHTQATTEDFDRENMGIAAKE